jgi:hypothetical protein
VNIKASITSTTPNELAPVGDLSIQLPVVVGSLI